MLRFDWYIILNCPRPHAITYTNGTVTLVDEIPPIFCFVFELREELHLHSKEMGVRNLQRVHHLGNFR